MDHRIIRNRLLPSSHSEAWALYLFLVSVSDAQGMSYYSDRSLSEHMGISTQSLSLARQELMKRDLIAWESPYYQVLQVASKQDPKITSPHRRGETLSIADFFNALGKGGVS